MKLKSDNLIIKGKPVSIEAVEIQNKIFVIQRGLISKLKMKQEILFDIGDPFCLISDLQKINPKIDLFTYIHRNSNEIESTQKYFFEDLKITALELTTFKDWWENKISSQTRKKIKRPPKRGIIIKSVKINDELIKGIIDIFNESPFRQGKRFWHYGKDFSTVKKEMSLDIDKCEFIGAYHNDQLIGIVKILYGDKVAEPTIILSKISYRKKYVNNALIAKCVEKCSEKNITYLIYGTWWRTEMAEFLRRHGFERIKFKRFWIPLTITGKIILKLRLHNGFKGYIPEFILDRLVKIRNNLNKKEASQ